MPRASTEVHPVTVELHGLLAGLLILTLLLGGRAIALTVRFSVSDFPLFARTLAAVGQLVITLFWFDSVSLTLAN